MGRGIRKRIDDLELLDDGAGPPVGDDKRQCIFVLRANVNEMNIEAVDFGDELRKSVQSPFNLAPVVLFRPILRNLLHCVELNALRCIPNQFLLRPSNRANSTTQFSKFRFRHMHMKRANGVAANPPLCGCNSLRARKCLANEFGAKCSSKTQYCARPEKTAA